MILRFVSFFPYLYLFPHPPCEEVFLNQHPKQHLHPRNLKWIPKIARIKRSYLFQSLILGPSMLVFRGVCKRHSQDLKGLDPLMPIFKVFQMEDRGSPLRFRTRNLHVFKVVVVGSFNWMIFSNFFCHGNPWLFNQTSINKHTWKPGGVLAFPYMIPG